MEATASIRHFRRVLRSLEREVELELQSQTACCGVSVSQCHLILELASRPESTVSELADSLALDKSTLSRLIESLRKAGWAVAERDPQDRRNLRVRLSREGQEMARRIDELCDREYGALFSGLSPREEEAVVEGTRLLAALLRDKRLRGRTEACCRVGQTVDDGTKGGADA